jgi:hypothetical protein
MSQQGEPEQIDRDYVRLLMVMRRFVREEFDIKIGISETEAAAKLLDYAERSRNEVLQEMGKELRSMLTPQQEAPSSETQEKVHYYRGVAQKVAGSSPTAESGTTEKAAAPQRIYRGRVVTG